MLGICQSFTSSHGLIFNASKTQTICFCLSQMSKFTPSIFFDNTKLTFVDEVSHLGHILTYNLNDKQDIIRVTKDMNRKANSILCKCSALDCAIKCYLIKSYCLSLYGSALWSLGSPSIKIIEISLNKILRKVWNLPRISHTRIVHCIASIPSISHLVYSRFCSLFSSASSSSSQLLLSAFANCAQLVYSPTGYNFTYGHSYCQEQYSFSDLHFANIIRDIRQFYGPKSPCEQIIHCLSCS